MLLLLMLMLMLGSNEALFSFKVFTMCPHIQAHLFNLQLGHVLLMFCHPTSVPVCSEASKDHCLSLAVFYKGILNGTLSLVFLQQSGGSGMSGGRRYFARYRCSTELSKGEL